MKKIASIAITAIIIALTGCSNPTPKADLNNEIDTLSYAIGMAQTNGLKDYLVYRLGVDTTYMADFIKGVNDGVNEKVSKKDIAYAAGTQIGQQIANQIIESINYQVFRDDSTQTISVNNFMAGFISGATGKGAFMTPEQAQVVTRTKMQSIQEKRVAAQYGHNKEAGKKFREEYAKKEGVKELANGVLYRVIKEGKGAIPADTSRVEVNYEGKLIDGTVFDSSYERGKSSVMRVNQVIKGWSEALTHMPVGSTWEIVIPEDQAYGASESAKIEPFSTLIFKVELISLPVGNNKKRGK